MPALARNGGTFVAAAASTETRTTSMPAALIGPIDLASAGNSSMQGAHQVAQKCTSVGFETE